jgi:hypothetical protein
MDGKQKAMLALALVVLVVGGYLIYTNLFAGSGTPAPAVQASASTTTTGSAPSNTTSAAQGPAQPPNRRAVTK